MRKEFLEHVLFVFGSLLTCAMVLWIAKVQAATNPSVVKAVIPVESIPETEGGSLLPAPEIALCQDPSAEEPTMAPVDRLCRENLDVFAASYATLAKTMDFEAILASQHAIRVDENALRTNVPFDSEENVEFANTDVDSENFERLGERLDDKMNHLCSSDRAFETGEDKTFSVAATRLLCEAVGSNEDLFRLRHATIVASKN